ncbi:MAG TPA: pilin [Candidatus Paceibacterota bacterium]|nr:pilin [Candidatus Paceibacterota bacterium]
MLNSKKIKKITTIVFLGLFLIGLSLPSSTNAAGGWYFATVSAGTTAAANGSFPTESSCKTARESEITRNYTNGSIHVDVSICVSIPKANATTQDVIDKNPTPWPDVSELVSGGQATIYWIMYHNNDNQYTILNFPTKQKCEDWWATGSNTDKILDKKCVTEKPIDPTLNVVLDTLKTKDTQKNYYPLAPLPELGNVIQLQPDCTINPDTKQVTCIPAKGFADYLNIMIKIFIGVCAVLAMVMIVMGGIQYMTSELVSSKQAAKETIVNAIFGLILALAAFAILNTINPKLVEVGLQEIPTATVPIDQEENITNVGNGTMINGVLVKMTKGTAATCSGGLVAVPSDIAGSGGNTRGVICNDLLNKLKTIKQKNPSFVITSTTTGTHQSQCHANINPPQEYPSTGNCADIGISGGSWDDLCVAVVEVGGLNFANEAVDTGKCAELKPHQTFQYTTGKHLHVNYTGLGGSNSTSPGSESLASATFDISKKQFTIKGSFNTKTAYRFYLYKSGSNIKILDGTFSAGASTLAIKTMSPSDYNLMTANGNTKVDFFAFKPTTPMKSIGNAKNINIK